jgi:MFS transporter, UMF1 family
VDFGLSVGLPSTALMKALILVQFVAFPCTLAFGHIGERFGAAVGLYLCLAVYIVMSFLAPLIRTEQHFFFMAAAVGSVQGGVQSLSRSHFAAMIQTGEAGQFFGVYNMLGKFSSFLGPFLVGVAALATGSSQAMGPVLLLLFVAGAVFLRLSGTRSNQHGPTNTGLQGRRAGSDGHQA